MNTLEKKLTVVEASKICGVTRSTVWRWIKMGQLDAATTSGGHHRINESVLKAFMDKKKMHSGNRANKLKQILIVDDDVSIQKYFGKILNKKRYDVLYASDGFEAGMKVIKYKPELVILDLFMPKMDGFKVCEQIKNEPETSETKIVAISGYDTKENRDRIMGIGADTFCPKPINLEQVLREVKALI